MSQRLTDKQKDVLAYLYKYINNNGYAPTYREIGFEVKLTNLAGVVNTRQVDYNLSALEKKEYITRGWKTPRTIKLTDAGRKRAEEILGIEPAKQAINAGRRLEVQILNIESTIQADGTESAEQAHRVPLLGDIAAGQPRGVFTELRQMIHVERELSGENIYVLVVKGDSMIEDCICDGDYVYIKQQPSYENGDIVAAFRSEQGLDSATLKRFYLEEEHDRVRLRPSNSKMNPTLVPKTEWEQKWQVQGKYIGLVRLHRSAKSLP